ncbi:hypothetical protein EOD39_0993 [Acipenser ruthenus]|nr:hypothetical protein EOD39_0993 [Acipenser ruthenus]
MSCLTHWQGQGPLETAVILKNAPVCEAGREQWCSSTSPSPVGETSSSVPGEEKREGATPSVFAAGSESGEWVSVEYQGRRFLHVFSPLEHCGLHGAQGAGVLCESWSIADYTEHGKLVFSMRAGASRITWSTGSWCSL